MDHSEDPEPTFPQMDTFATIATVAGAVVGFFGLVVALQISKAAGGWSVLSSGALLGGIGFGLLIILVAQALHVLVALEENTREILEVLDEESSTNRTHQT